MAMAGNGDCPPTRRLAKQGHILFLTDNFPPEVNAPASRTFEHCREWVRAGHRVTVITCAPNFPTGKIFPGYRNKLWQSEELCGIRVIRVWSYMTRNEGFFLRVLDHISFMVSAAIAALFVRRVDVIIGTSPQFFTACAAYIAAILLRKPWVFEVRDLWPEAIRALGAIKSVSLFRFIEAIELHLYRRASLIIAVTHAFRANLVQRGIGGDKIRVVTNGVDLAHFSARPRDEQLIAQLQLNGKFVVGYVGTHGMSHALATIVEAFSLLAADRDAQDIHLLMIGDGAEKPGLIEQATVRGLSNISFIDTVAKSDVARYWALLDLSIVHLKKVDVHRTVIPSKIFESMAMGVPILHGARGESEDIVKDAGAGTAFEQEDAADLAAKILELSRNPSALRTMSGAGVSAAPRYDRQALAQAMLQEIQQLWTADGKAPARHSDCVQTPTRL